MLCWFLGHSFHERQWGPCIRCGHEEPPDPPTFEEGYYHGLWTAEQLLRAWAQVLEESNSELTAVEATHMLIKALKDKSGPDGN